MAPTAVWCLLINFKKDPKGNRFEVLVEEHIAELKKKVKQQKLNTLKDVDANELLVWRCKDQPTLKPGNLKNQVEMIFSQGPEELHETAKMADLAVTGDETLFVQMPKPYHATTPSIPHEELDLSKLDNEERCIRLLCKRYWGKGEKGWKNILRTERVTVPHLEPHLDKAPPLEPGTSSKATTSLSDCDTDGTGASIPEVKPSQQSLEVLYDSICLDPDIKDFFPILSDSMLIRVEYQRLVEHLQDLHQMRARGVVLTGRPGIGKSMFLFYLLISRVLYGKPTAFQRDDSRTFMLMGPSDLDIQIFKNTQRIDPVGFPDVWALTDSNANLVTPRGEFVSTSSKFFLIQATPPQPARWKAWSKELSGHLVVMNPWSWKEVYIAGIKLSRPSTNMNTETLWDVFTKYGGSFRQCHDLTCFPEELQRWEASLSTKLKVMPKPEVFQALYQGFATNMNSDALLTTYSDIITLTANEKHQPVITFASQHITDCYYEAVLKTDAHLFWECFNLFWSVKESHDSAGWMWEGQVVAKGLKRGQDRTMELKQLGPASNSSLDSIPHPAKKQRTVQEQLSLPYTCDTIHGDMQSLSGEVSRLCPFIKSQKPLLFMPGHRNQATFDAFSISADGLVTIFQPTIQGSHSINASRLDFIWDALSNAQKHAPNIKKLLPSKENQWHIVFVVPKMVEEEWTTSQLIDFQGIQAKQKWEDYTKQFVIAFEDAPEQETDQRGNI